MMSDMDTSLRGFSFMPETDIKIKEIDLQYVEDSELERTWRSSRRERMKLQEQKIWEDFIQEQDIVRSVCQSDRYQFIEQLSESCLKELLESNSNRGQETQETLVEGKAEDVERVETASSLSETRPPSDNIERENEIATSQDNHNVLHIYHDDKENEDLSGNEGEPLNDSGGSPLCTVREKIEEQEEQPQEQPNRTTEKISNKLTGNMNSVIENSIYCARVKDLRIRINEEILSIITSIERLSINNLDLEELKKIMKRSSEFCSRFSRIHLYQLQRQMHDMTRSSSTQLPYGQHTQHQAHMVRVVSLHQNILQAFCAFHKSFGQTHCASDSSHFGAVLAQLVREIPAPAYAHAHTATRDLYSDNVLETCEKLEHALNEHTEKMTEYMKSLENNNRNTKKSQKNKDKQKCPSIYKTSSRADGKLSMYSLDTLRINLKAKSSTSKKNIASGTSKSGASPTKTIEKQTTKKLAGGKRKKSPMKQRVGRDVEVRTMVEGVTACASSHVSLVPSIQYSPVTAKNMTYRNKVPSKESTPRSKLADLSRRSQKVKTKPNTASTDLKIECDGKLSVREEAPSETTRSSRETNLSTLPHDGSESRRSENRYRLPESGIASAEVTRLLRELCGGDATGSKSERVSGARNAQLLCVSSDSPRQPTTPQLLRILEETIQKKSPRSMNVKLSSIKNAEKYRMPFNISEKTVENLFQYRTKFVQHMLSSAMYANSAVEKPWEMVNCVSEQIIDELLLTCAKELELQNIVQQLYQSETK